MGQAGVLTFKCALDGSGKSGVGVHTRIRAGIILRIRCQDIMKRKNGLFSSLGKFAQAKEY